MNNHHWLPKDKQKMVCQPLLFFFNKLLYVLFGTGTRYGIDDVNDMPHSLR